MAVKVECGMCGKNKSETNIYRMFIRDQSARGKQQNVCQKCLDTKVKIGF